MAGISQPQKDTLYANGGGEYLLNKHLFLYATDSLASPAEVYGLPSGFTLLYPKKAFVAGASRHYYWLVFTIKNKDARDGSFFYQLNNPGLNIVKVYIKRERDFEFLGEAGDNLPFKARPYEYYDIVFPFYLAKGEAATVIAVIDNASDNVDFLPQLTDTNTFKAKEERYYTVIGVISGIMLTAFLLNLFLAYSLKDRLHLLYSIYILLMLFEMYVIQGIDVQYIYPNHPMLSDLCKYFSPALGLTVMAYVMQIFLQQSKANSRLKIAVDIFKYLIIFLIPVWLVIYFRFNGSRVARGIYQQVFAISLAVQLFLFFLSALERALQRYKPAYFYLAGIVYLWYGAIQYVLNILGVDTKEMIEKHPNDLQIGIVIETLVVFFGIIYRYNFYKKEKDQLAMQLQEEKLKSARDVLDTQLQEQKRIAADLHDEMGGNLAALKMALQTIPVSSSQASSLNALIDRVSTHARHIAHNLMPPEFEETSMNELLEKFYRQLNTEGSIRFQFHATVSQHLPAPWFGKQQELMIYRILMELTNNIIRHSAATEATMQMVYHQDHLTLMAEDNGKGFTEGGGWGIGLKSIHSRLNFLNGQYQTDTGANGTTTTIHIPYQLPEAGLGAALPKGGF